MARTLTDVHATLQQTADHADMPWLERFRVRYLGLDLSHALYRIWREGPAPLG